MEITNLVRPAAAEIITITSLRPGDVYSRLQKESYSDRWYMIIGVVQTVHHNGTDAAFTAFEVNQQTRAIELKAYGTGADLALFPATPEEAHAVLGDARDQALSEYEDAKRKLDKAKGMVTLVDSVIMSAGEITQAPTTTALASS